MATSLYDLSVPTFLQTVTAVAGFLDRAAAHCAQTGADPDDFVEARLFADMAPFHFQIEAAWHHAVWGVEALRTGAFTPPALVGPVPFAALRAMIAEGQAALAAFDRDEIDGCAGKDLDLLPGELGLGQLVPAGQVESLDRTLQRRAEMFLGTQQRPHNLELLVGQANNPHAVPPTFGGSRVARRN